MWRQYFMRTNVDAYVQRCWWLGAADGIGLRGGSEREQRARVGA